MKKTPKVAYVRSKELFEGYIGTKEAKGRYAKNTDDITANLDTLTQEFNKSLAEFNSSYQKMNAREREEKKKLLTYQKGNLDKYNELMEDKIHEEDQKLTQGVLNQVNTFVTEYGDAHGYDVIFGTNLNGNIIYGAKAYDLTEEILDALNKKYKSAPVK
jgi:outer membrane protein